MVESFIIHIYRRDDAKRELAGVVERVGDGAKTPFSNIDDLWRCLGTSPSSRRRLRRGKPGAPDPGE